MNEQNNREEAKDYDPMKAEQEYHENEACLRPNAGLYNPEMNVMADDYDMESGDGTEKIGGCTVSTHTLPFDIGKLTKGEQKTLKYCFEDKENGANPHTKVTLDYVPKSSVTKATSEKYAGVIRITGDGWQYYPKKSRKPETEAFAKLDDIKEYLCNELKLAKFVHCR